MESPLPLPQPPRKRRPRTNVKQLEILNEAYTLDPMPCSAYREMLGDLVGLSNRSIQICKLTSLIKGFQNRRQKLKLEENQTINLEINMKKERILNILETWVSKNERLPSDHDLVELSDACGISTSNIKVWINNRLSQEDTGAKLPKRREVKKSVPATISSPVVSPLVKSEDKVTDAEPDMGSIDSQSTTCTPGTTTAPTFFVQDGMGNFLPIPTAQVPLSVQVQTIPGMGYINPMSLNQVYPETTMDFGYGMQIDSPIVEEEVGCQQSFWNWNYFQTPVAEVAKVEEMEEERRLTDELMKEFMIFQ